jgi:plastocyanin
VLIRAGLLSAALLVLAVGYARGQDAAEIRLVPRTDDAERPFAFEPDTLTVPAGTTVRWVNAADVFHTVTFADSRDVRVPNGTFDQSLATAGQAVERQFDQPGTFFYYCQPHSAFMAGTIVVTEAPGVNPLLVITLAALALAALAAVTVWRLRRDERAEPL